LASPNSQKKARLPGANSHCWRGLEVRGKYFLHFTTCLTILYMLYVITARITWQLNPYLPTTLTTTILSFIAYNPTGLSCYLFPTLTFFCYSRTRQKKTRLYFAPTREHLFPHRHKSGLVPPFGYSPKHPLILYATNRKKFINTISLPNTVTLIGKIIDKPCT